VLLKLINWFRRHLKRHDPLPEPGPDRSEYMTADRTRQVFRDALEDLIAKQFRGFVPWLVDTIYYAPSVQYARRIIAKEQIHRRTYAKDRYDCDDFAITLKNAFVEDAYRHGERRAAHLFGIAKGLLPGPHQMNWMINDDGILRFVEPQTGEIFLPDKRIIQIWWGEA